MKRERAAERLRDTVDQARRRLALGLAAGLVTTAAPRLADAAPGGLGAEAAGLKPGAGGDQSRAFARALERAAREGRPLTLAPGVYRAARVALPEGAAIVGVPELTRIELSEPGPLFTGKGLRRVALRGLLLDGSNLPGGLQAGLIQFEDVAAFAFDDLAIEDAGGSGLALFRSGGALRGSRIANARQSGLFAMDGRGITVADNVITGCRNNGVVIRRTAKGDDGAVVSRNRIEDTGALDGGLGWNGNAVNVSKASGVVVSGNAIRRSAFTAVRAHESSDVVIADNLCLDCGETGLYVEYGFSGAVVSGNLVDGAANGVSIANFNEGGRLAAVTGNVVRNLFRRRKLDQPGEGYGQGIGVEADVAVTGNVIENAASFGVHAGWGPYMRDVAISGNIVRNCEVGIGVSVVEGVGPATIVGNTVTGSRKGAVVGYRWAEAATPDLGAAGSGGLPGLTVAQNTVR
ncbi:TIGR03808 family TAT-translocated repetitive protein [Methylopila henanensis]|uniref:TIGR03808 family TAT-translocated repetitive protein n=1 Tax=Methylopila henanensis TaxID=873516 RepID=A0ABW4K3X1_9HYPH